MKFVITIEPFEPNEPVKLYSFEGTEEEAFQYAQAMEGNCFVDDLETFFKVLPNIKEVI